MVFFPDPRKKRRWRERGRLYRVLAYATIIAWVVIIAVVVLALCAPLEEDLDAQATPRPAVPTPPPGDYRGGPATCALLGEVREAVLDGEIDDAQLRGRLDEIMRSVAASEPALQAASRQIVAAVDLGRMDSFAEAIDMMAETCLVYGYLDPP